MGLELFLDLYSPPCRSVYIFARKNAIPFQLRSVQLARGDHLKSEFLEVNPLGKVPALRDGDFLLAESVAILLYLSRKFQAVDHWYPLGLQARARVDECLAWQHSAIQLPATNVYLCRSLLPHFLGQPVDSMKLEGLLGRLAPALQHLDRTVLTARSFLATEQISLADLVVFSELMQPTAVGCDLFRDRPHLAAWRARVEAFLGPELIQDAHELVLQPRDRRRPFRTPS